jgi:hypothetical protein
MVKKNWIAMIKVKVSSMHKIDKEVAKLFRNILKDYMVRFDVLERGDIKEVYFCFVDLPETGHDGTAIYEDVGERIVVQIRDPAISDNTGEPSKYAIAKMVQTLCHEIVHVCQRITGRKGFSIPKAKINKSSKDEVYFFDPLEVEARVLEQFYTYTYGSKLL